jgi:hypothetical protein
MSSTSFSDPTPAWSHRVKHSERSSMNPSSIELPTSLRADSRACGAERRAPGTRQVGGRRSRVMRINGYHETGI